MIERLQKDVLKKVDLHDYKKQIAQIEEKVRDVEEETNLKSSIKDVCVLLDQKSNIEDVNKALTEIHDELDTKASEESYQLSVREQNQINEILCAENCVA